MIRRIGVIWLVVMFEITARAEDIDPQARDLFTAAEEAFARGRVGEARRLFEQSLERSPAAATAFNLAIAHREAADYLQASEMFGRLILGDFGELDEDRRAEVLQLRSEVRQRLASVEVRIEGVENAEVLVDGRSLGHTRSGRQGLRTTVNPGQHIVGGRALMADPVDRTLDLREGGRQSVTLRMTPRELDTSDSPVIWPWLVGGILVSAAAAVLVAVLLTDSGLPDELVFGEVLTLRSP